MTQKPPRLPRLYRARLRLGDAFRNTRLRLGNTLKRRFRKEMGYFVLDLKGELPEFSPPPPRWRRFLPMLGFPDGHPPLSLSDLRVALEMIAADPRPKGVVLRLDELSVGWATAQSVRGLLAEFRQSGKRIIAHSSYGFDTRTYFVATAADQIYAPPSTNWQVIGLYTETLYLKDALEPWGIHADVIAVSPYKTAGEPLARADMSPEQREMLNWRLDGVFNALLQAIANGRKLPEDEVRALIDRAPFSMEEAKQAGLVDDALYLDELPARLSQHEQQTPVPAGENPDLDPSANLRGIMVPLEEGHRALLAPIRKRSGRLIGLISLEGTILPGESRDIPSPIPIPLLGNQQAGADTLIQAFRTIEDDPRIAAVVLHVDSPGGSALASDLIWREVERVQRKKPVVVYMGNVAASGGYYVAAPANWIVAQPLTVTGSIGVLFMKLALDGLFSLFSVNRVAMQRGAHAGIFADISPLSEELRAAVEKEILTTYSQFKDRVSAGRKLAPEQLEPLAGGRVWLGEQAHAHRLVDELGDLKRAVDKAKELAELPEDLWTPVVWINVGRNGALPAPFPSESPAEWVKRLARTMDEKVWMISPFEEEIK